MDDGIYFDDFDKYSNNFHFFKSLQSLFSQGTKENGRQGSCLSSIKNYVTKRFSEFG